MINIQRTDKIPTSLQSQEVRNYLDALAQYLEDKIGNPEPKEPNTYRSWDVLDAFDLCFFSKCYLTEQKFTNSWAMDIDHFIPKNERPDLVFEWKNLYPAEHKTNMNRRRKTPPGGYLDPCLPSDDVENDILYFLFCQGQVPKFKALDETNLKAVNTSTLLDELHNGKVNDENSIKNTEELRSLIKKRYDEIMENLAEFLGAKNNSNSSAEFEAKEKLRRLLSRKAAFTMLMRSIEPVKKYVPTELLD